MSKEAKSDANENSSQVVTKRKKGNPALKKGGPSLNPKGRPKGLPDSRSLFRKALDKKPGELDAFVEGIINRAKKGDPAAMRIVAERVCAPIKPKDDPVNIPNMSGKSPLQQADALIAAVASGNLTPAEGSIVMGLLRDRAAIHEATELEKRIAELEKRLNGGQNPPAN